MDLAFFKSLRLVLAAFNWGAICFVQWIHYPLFRDVERSHFSAYHRKHVRNTTWLLGTSLSVEMVLNVFFLALYPHEFGSWICITCLSAGWLITFFMSVPQHRHLENGFEPRAHRLLLISNAIRVVSWGTLCSYLMVQGD